MIARILFFIFGTILTSTVFAARDVGIGKQPGYSIIRDVWSWTFTDVLAFIEWMLLKVVLPVVIVGAWLYIAYKLFLAEWNEEENKKAWKALTFASIGVISIGLAYAVIAIVSWLSL